MPIIRATRLMIDAHRRTSGLMLTKGGALSRADVKALFDATEWPDFDRAAVLAVNKVLNEDDVLPVLFTRMMAKEAGLLRAYKGRLLATKRAKELIQPERAPRPLPGRLRDGLLADQPGLPRPHAGRVIGPNRVVHVEC